MVGAVRAGGPPPPSWARFALAHPGRIVRQFGHSSIPKGCIGVFVVCYDAGWR